MSTASSTSTSAKPSPRSILEAKNCSKSAARDQRGCLILRKNLARSEEHTSELQSRLHLVCRLLLEKKKILHESRAPHSLPCADSVCRCAARCIGSPVGPDVSWPIAHCGVGAVLLAQVHPCIHSVLC